jgi:hypothetical protein
MTGSVTRREREVAALDLAFVVDTTGSMSSLIAGAQRQMITMLDELLRVAAVDLRLGVVEYRDHVPQDPLTYRVHAFTGDLDAARRTINGLAATGGGDGPESVLDGIWAACQDLAWRRHARRIAVLVGDSPPHGMGAPGDAFPQGCPCGQTLASVTAAAEEARVTFYAIALSSHLEPSFGVLSRYTGGEFFATHRQGAALERLAAILTAEFGALDFDRRVLDAWDADVEAGAGTALDELARRLETSRPALSAALSRLGARDLLRRAAAQA